MDSPDLNAMALFARIVQYGSFSQAAARTGLPVSTLSRRIVALEQHLGTRLLERTTRSLKPTPAGRDFLPHCQPLLAALESAGTALDTRQKEPAGILRLATPPSLSEFLIVPLIQGFLARYPKVSVRVLVTDRHLDLVEDEVDLSLRVGRQPESSLIFKRLLRYRHILVAAPASLSRLPAPKHPSRLREHRLLGFCKWFGDVTWKLTRRGVTEKLTIKPAIGINDYAGILRAAVDGIGIAEVPAILCQQQILSGQLLPVLPDWQFDEVDLSAYYLTRRHPVPVVESFLAHAAAYCAALPPPVTVPPSGPRGIKSKRRP